MASSTLECNPLFDRKPLATAPEVKPVVRLASEKEPAIREALESVGLRLRVSWPTSCNGRFLTAHWQIDCWFGGRVIDYWPGTGRWRCPVTGDRGRIARPEDLLLLTDRIRDQACRW